MSDLVHFSPEIETISETDSSIHTTPATRAHQALKFSCIPLSSHLLKISIEVDTSVVDSLNSKALDSFKNGNVEGIDKNNIPTEYIHEAYQAEIRRKIKHYLFQHLVTDMLMHEVGVRKINIANYFRLSSIEKLNSGGIVYHFDVSIADPIELKEWKNFAFKSPKRKRYKDLDKQVIFFIESQTVSKKSITHSIEKGDWVLFDATLLNAQNMPLNTNLTSSFWICAGHQAVNEPFIEELLGKNIKDSFISNNLDTLHQDATLHTHTYTFRIDIKATVKGSGFSVDMFRTNFKLKNKIEIHNKLMEVFSYRNDTSQRKAIIDEVFHLLLSKHRFEIPKHLVLRRQEDIVQILSQQPDYHVYKANKDFEIFVEMLAEKQLKEEIIIDQISQTEHIKTDIRDATQYLHLWSNKRLKEFIYFKPLLVNLDDTENLINTTIFNQAVLREKTLNHVIHVLSR